MKEKSSSSIAENIKRLQDEIAEAAIQAGRDPKEVTLMAVTKTVPAEEVNLAIDSGITLLGENRAQELESKFLAYDKEGVDIHFIGHMQSNKVRHIVDKVTMIHSVDRISLVKEIDKRARAIDTVMDVLLQVNIGEEESKSGVLAKEAVDFSKRLQEYPNLRLRGLMAIPPWVDNQNQQEHYFSKMNELLVDIQAKNRDNKSIDVLSTGMSGDFIAAIKHGATIVRIGTAIFGEREYS